VEPGRRGRRVGPWRASEAAKEGGYPWGGRHIGPKTGSCPWKRLSAVMPKPSYELPPDAPPEVREAAAWLDANPLPSRWPFLAVFAAMLGWAVWSGHVAPPTGPELVALAGLALFVVFAALRVRSAKWAERGAAQQVLEAHGTRPRGTEAGVDPRLASLVALTDDPDLIDAARRATTRAAQLRQALADLPEGTLRQQLQDEADALDAGLAELRASLLLVQGDTDGAEARQALDHARQRLAAQAEVAALRQR
jgi:hypothetical protein